MLREFYNVFCALNRRAELKRLAAWAQRKRLPGPRRLYQSRLGDEETRLLRYRVRSPRLYTCAHLAHLIGKLGNPPRRFYARGSAAAYRYRPISAHRHPVFSFQGVWENSIGRGLGRLAGLWKGGHAAT